VVSAESRPLTIVQDKGGVIPSYIQKGKILSLYDHSASLLHPPINIGDQNHETLMSLYGATLDASGAFMAQLFGAAFILLGLLLWLMRNTSEASTVKAFSISLFFGDAVGFVVSLMAVLNGVVNGLGWTTVALYLFIGLGFGYFWIKPPATR
jgi:hypothetical protein